VEFGTVSREGCPICGSSTVVHLYDLWDDRFGQPDAYPLRICEACEFAFLGTIVSADEVGRLYAKYYPRPGQDAAKPVRCSDGLLARFARWLDGNINPAYSIQPGETVLDVGCGTGVGLQIGKLRGAQAEGLEVDESVVRKVRARGLTCHLGALDNCPALAGRQYDRVILDQVLEHIEDPVGALRRCLALLKPNGSIVVAAPHLNGLLRSVYGRRWLSWHAPYHVNHFSRRALEKAAALASLAVTSFRLRTPSNWILAQLRLGRAVRGQTNMHFSVQFPVWQRSLVAPLGKLMALAGRGEAFLAVLKTASGNGTRLSA
jgi:2-polyprenyl-3-methyl-5-hydroxy-6-metoxy-1,4-benzoquinol methylase